MKLGPVRRGFWLALFASPAMAYGATSAVVGLFTRMAASEQSVRGLESRITEVTRRFERELDHLRADRCACPRP